MSTLKVTNIQDTAGGNSSTSAEIFEGRAKAWAFVQVDAGTPSVLNDYNVNSVTDLDVGSFQINFDSSLPSSNYSVAGCVVSTSNSRTFMFHTRATGSFRCNLRNVGDESRVDNDFAFVVHE